MKEKDSMNTVTPTTKQWKAN